MDSLRGQRLVHPALDGWVRTSLRRVAARHPRLRQPGRRGPKRKLLLVHLDGVPHRLLRRALQEERMPFLSRLVRSGHHRLDTAFWGTPASTPCFQAGLLYGLRHPDLPAYHWFDRASGREVKMNVPKDAAFIEARLGRATHSGLLENGGTSYLSIFRGGASNEVAMSSLSSIQRLARAAGTELWGLRGPKRQEVCAYLAWMMGDAWDSAVEISQWARRIQDWRHEGSFFVSRVFLLRLGWELGHSRALIDMWRGVPAIYLVYSNYDEAAHRRGPFSALAQAELFAVDGALEELFAFANVVPEPYDIVLLTDHGHVDSAPFEQRGGMPIRTFLLEGPALPLDLELSRSLVLGGKPEALPRQTSGRGGEGAAHGEGPVVVPAGNFAHVYFEGGAALDAQDIVRRHPHVLARAVASPDVAVVTLRRGDGAVAIVENQAYSPEALGDAPLPQAISRRALADALAELPRTPSAGDLVLYGAPVSAEGTVGFAWEFGSHGGLTHTEVESSVLWPVNAPLHLEGLSHSTELHHRLSELYRS